MSEPDTPTTDTLYPCVGICLPDADEAYCIGCGRPWGAPVLPAVPAVPDPPTTARDEQSAA